MKNNSIYLGEQEAHFNEPEIEGKLINFEGEKYYKISR